MDAKIDTEKNPDLTYFVQCHKKPLSFIPWSTTQSDQNKMFKSNNKSILNTSKVYFGIIP